jgi:4-amino-4-deoxy-L-arabinose transferase-like glycosyltransferase
MKSDDRVIAALLALLTVGLLLGTSGAIGVTSDEPVYMEAAESYMGWFRELATQPGSALTAEKIDYYWGFNSEHPPADKLWTGLVWAASRGFLDDLTAHRLGNILLSGVVFGLLYLMVAGAYVRMAGLAAAAALVTMPRFFFHSHVAALDVSVTLAIFATCYAFYATRDRQGAVPSVLVRMILGLTLLVKVTGALALPIMLLWAILFERRRQMILRLGLAIPISGAVFFALWPWLYRDTLNRTLGYLGFFSDHNPVPMLYLGQVTSFPPWHFPFVIVLAVVPAFLTLLYIAGVVRTFRDPTGLALGGLLVIGALVPMIALTTGKMTVFNNDRFLMPSFPYLAALAGIGFHWAVRRMGSLIARYMSAGRAGIMATAIVAALFLPHILSAIAVYPHLLSYYSEVVGGLPGANRLGLETTYWSETLGEALPYLNERAEPEAIVWTGDNYSVLLYYQLQGQLRRDLRIAGARPTSLYRKGISEYRATMEEADYLVLQYWEGRFIQELEHAGRELKLAFRLSHRGIPLMDVYSRP